MAKIYYARVDEFWRREQKYVFLYEKQRPGDVEWQTLQPDVRQTWLTQGMLQDFSTYLALGSKESKLSAKASVNVESIMKSYTLGVVSARDSHVYSFNQDELRKRAKVFIEIYNSTVERRKQRNGSLSVEELIDVTDPKIKWSRQVKNSLGRLQYSSLLHDHFRISLYRPFTKTFHYFDDFWNEERYQLPQILPNDFTEKENLLICLTSPGSEKPFQAILSCHIVDYHLSGPGCGTPCFPFYTYAEDGTNRRENITDWALDQFRKHYNDPAITKWNIFHYVYAVLHHPAYRERYAANLKRELPRIPFAPDFRAFAEAGAQLAELHVNYEQQPEYPLEKIEAPNEALDWRVEKMKLSKDKTRIVYNKFLTLDGIPPEAFEYRLGNRSALEWVIDQYQVSTDKRSGITNDPNREDDPEYIVRLIGQVITVSLETMKIVKSLPDAFVVPPLGG